MTEKLKYPLSIGQKGLWLLHQLDPISDRYNMPLTFKFFEHVEITNLENALNIFIQRHEMLRSQFKVIKGQPFRVPSEELSINISSIEIDMANHQALLGQIKKMTSVPFDLEKDPLVRADLLCGLNDKILLLTIHHLVFDGTSLKTFCDELEEIYCFVINGGPELAPDTQQLNFQCFQSWQDQWIRSDEAQKSHSYWMNKLSGELPQLNIPHDQGSMTDEVIIGDFIKFTLPQHIVTTFKSIADDHKCSEYAVWLTAYFAFLARYTTVNDLVVGTPSMGRPNSDFDQLIGYFVNLIPLRCQINPDESFNDLLGRFKNDIFEGLMNADYPLAKMIDGLSDIHLRGDQPLFQSSFIWTTVEHLKAKENSLLGLEIHPLLHESGEQDFSFEILSSNDVTKGLFKYRTNCFSLKFVKRIKHSFINFLNNLCLEPQSQLKEISLIDENDEHKLLFELNPQLTVEFENKCIHQIFEQQARKNPNHTAVNFENQRLSFRNLNEQANQLAHLLITKGIKSNELIGLYIDRSIEMVTAILGILKAGAAYVPLEPNYPQSRLNEIIKSSQIQHIISIQKWRDQLLDVDYDCVYFDEPAVKETLNQSSIVNPDLGFITGESLAYVLYTSGSSGKPKGVLQRHKTLTNLMYAQSVDGGLTDSMNTLQFAPFSFDVSIQEMVTAWYSGSTLTIISQHDKDDLSKLPKLLKLLKIERVFFPPQVMLWIADFIKNKNFLLPSLKEIVVAGEALIVTQILKVFVEESSCRIWNQYGPTETHVVTSYEIDKDVKVGPAPIGTSLANFSLYVLDPYKQLVPYGAVGELYVGGIGLAAGYLNSTKLTKERFIQHPYSYDENEILYRTGDLVRYSDCDGFEFIGRIDEQVKINGFRIELGEIEQQLNNLRNIDSAFVSVYEDSNQHKHLVAYVTTKNNDSNCELVNEVRKSLQTVLPSYMIPTKIIQTNELPLTENGKIDRKFSPYFDEEQFVESYVIPSSDTEILLLGIWSKLLTLTEDKISAKANFFELGGHSLLVAQLLNEIVEIFDVEIAYKDIFTYSKLNELSELIEQKIATNELQQKLDLFESNVNELEW